MKNMGEFLDGKYFHRPCLTWLYFGDEKIDIWLKILNNHWLTVFNKALFNDLWILNRQWFLFLLLMCIYVLFVL